MTLWYRYTDLYPYVHNPKCMVVVIMHGRHRWEVRVCGPVPVVPVLGCPVVAVCMLGGFLCLMLWFPRLMCLVPVVELMMSILVDHPLKLFKLAPVIVVIYKLPKLMYFISLIFEPLRLVSCSFTLVYLILNLPLLIYLACNLVFRCFMLESVVIMLVTVVVRCGMVWVAVVGFIAVGFAMIRLIVIGLVVVKV